MSNAQPDSFARLLVMALSLVCLALTPPSSAQDAGGHDHPHGDELAKEVEEIFRRVRMHDFHPLGHDGSMTVDRRLRVDGIADLDDNDWRVRLTAIAGLVRRLPDATEAVIDGLEDGDLHVRQVAAAALGICRTTEASGPLRRRLAEDASPIVRSQAAMSLGQMESQPSLGQLREAQENDPSRDVRHQCELAIDQIEKGAGATAAHRKAFIDLEPSTFGSVEVSEPAPDFELLDTDGEPWRLTEANRGRWVVLLWIFADWCPVCHHEFRDLIGAKEQFEEADVELVTLECHDRYRCRVMSGKELAPQYWFAKQAPQPLYKSGIWWPHLVDHAGAVAARYGADPMCFAVHAEYINRPTTIIIDPDGVVRFAYRGTYWGDRPTVEQTLEMIREQSFDFVHKNRRQR